ncbi:PorT family protein [Hymenobacter sp. BT683]|uniref:PorT family protein n=1 Tax=Hymenobacter jeongseonensis TaxID=2791027 RepID=A0ABS0IME7_9BACT|nr:porin family protein [Hymenobacter jeongseonensis]MBF9239501.1 PorT family protein [Hymenobacter jeongseonensis]
MRRTFTSSLLASCLLLAASSANAQTTFRIGPQVGYNLSSSSMRYPNLHPYMSLNNYYRSGAEAGLVAQVGLSDHFAVQPAVLYAQKGYGYVVHNNYDPSTFTYSRETAFRVAYLTMPVNVVYSQRPNSEGMQVFVGPYLGYLLGGTYTFSVDETNVSGSSRSVTNKGKVVASDSYDNLPDSKYESKGLDVGLQAGVGYGFAGGLQVQVSYSQGLRNLAATYENGQDFSIAPVYQNPSYRNRTLQLSLAYLFGPKS